jgi:spore maturation protein CgeB
MKIIYLGSADTGSTSIQRANALKRLGCEVEVFDPVDAFKQKLRFSVINKFHYYTGYEFLQKHVYKWLDKTFSNVPLPDIIWINGGEFLGPLCMELVKQKNVPIILYNNDDPTGGRDKGRFNMLLKALSYYNLCAVMRQINVAEYYSKGAKKVLKVTMSYDEEMHKPFKSIADIPVSMRSEICFIGTWMYGEDRDVFLIDLIEKKLPVSIWGGRWKKSKYWDKLRPFHRGDILTGRDYTAAIQGSKICLGFLSKGNRDLHTQRSLEIPFAGGLFCGERTSEHMDMYQEGKEAVFWKDSAECAKICLELLSDDNRRESIREAGMKRIRNLKMGNEDICKMILKEANKEFSSNIF